MTETNYNGSTPLVRYRLPALAVGVLALIATIIGGVLLDHQQFFRSYLYAYVFWVMIPLGGLGLLMVQYLSGGVWGIIIRRPLEAMTRTLPLMAIAFVPVVFGLHSVYEWMHSEVVAKDPILSQKAGYLNEPAFIIRTVVYFILWIGTAMLVNRFAREHERTDSLEAGLRVRRVSAFGLVMLGLTLTLASVDWVMSLEPHWFSTMYGFSFMVGCLIPAMALAILVLAANRKVEPLATVARPVHYRDLGNLTFAFVMLWAYTGFSQFLLIWYGNLREEIPWYLKRAQGPWLAIAMFLLVMHFFVPFFILLNRSVKDRPQRLAGVAVVLIILRAVDLFWIMVPAFTGNEFRIHWMDITALIGVGGIWVALFLSSLSKRPLVPGNEPYVREVVAKEVLTHG